MKRENPVVKARLRGPVRGVTARFHAIGTMEFRAVRGGMVLTRQSGGGVTMPGIIVGIDGSAHSHWAFEWAMHEATARHAAVIALNVQPQGSISYTGDRPNLDRAVGGVRALAGRVMSLQPGPAPLIIANVVVGSPATELIDASPDADLLVVGARGSDGFGRRGLGSVSSRVAYEARCPVVIIFQPTSTHLTARSAAVNQPGTRGPQVRAVAASVS